MHAGAEGASHEHVRSQTETFLGENRGNAVAFSHAVVRAGADLVVGSGPHVLRGMEWYRGRLIAYSLGNFLGNGTLAITGPGGVSAVLHVKLRRNGSWAGGRLVPVLLVSPGVPALDGAGAALQEVRSLLEGRLRAELGSCEPDGRAPAARLAQGLTARELDQPDDDALVRRVLEAIRARERDPERLLSVGSADGEARIAAVLSHHTEVVVARRSPLRRLQSRPGDRGNREENDPDEKNEHPLVFSCRHLPASTDRWSTRAWLNGEVRDCGAAVPLRPGALGITEGGELPIAEPVNSVRA